MESYVWLYMLNILLPLLHPLLKDPHQFFYLEVKIFLVTHYLVLPRHSGKHYHTHHQDIERPNVHRRELEVIL